jgi:thymidylate synthase
MSSLIAEGTLDDLMRRAMFLALEHGTPIRPSKGPALDLIGTTLELSNPHCRLSRSATRGVLFSSLGELCWYLSGSNETEQIAYYLSHYRDQDEGGVVRAGYGPRLFVPPGSSPIETAIALLRRNPHSRRAVVPIFDANDLEEEHKEVPCTCLLQFLVRDGQLNAITYMRSNDIFLGLPHDIFAFTMLQELVSRSLDIPLGRYIHMTGSLHLYETDIAKTRQFLREGWQSTTPMPAMPEQDPWGMVRLLLEAEEALREGTEPFALTLPESPYWADLVRILQVFSLVRRERRSEIPNVSHAFASSVYGLFATDKIDVSREGN